jgi:hypothetical protein
MAIQTKDDAQDKASRKVDRNLHKQKKELPLVERDFRDLVTLKDQFEWIKLKQKQQQYKEWKKL